MANILIVEDEGVLRGALKDKFLEAGYGVLESADGAQGLEMALDREPDMILLDIRMPNMTGFEMLKKLRAKNSWGAKVPVIFFTNIEPTSDQEMADVEGLGPTDYLIKSDTDLDAILAKVKGYLG